ncbi:hypothetical protein GVAV_001683 [Gurleya vavrai]
MAKQICREFKESKTCRFGERCRFLHAVQTSLVNPPTWIFSSFDNLNLNTFSHEEIRAYHYLFMKNEEMQSFVNTFDSLWLSNYFTLCEELNKLCKENEIVGYEDYVVDFRKNYEYFVKPFVKENVYEEIKKKNEKESENLEGQLEKKEFVRKEFMHERRGNEYNGHANGFHADRKNFNYAERKVYEKRDFSFDRNNAPYRREEFAERREYRPERRNNFVERREFINENPRDQFIGRKDFYDNEYRNKPVYADKKNYVERRNINYAENDRKVSNVNDFSSNKFQFDYARISKNGQENVMYNKYGEEINKKPFNPNYHKTPRNSNPFQKNYYSEENLQKSIPIEKKEKKKTLDDLFDERDKKY